MNPLRIRPASLGFALATPLRCAGTIPATRQFPFCSFFSSSASSYASAPSSAIPKAVPAPIPIVPDVDAFLHIIGRNMKQHASKFPTWEALFTLSSQQLKELGIEPPRDRRYLLRWLERFREGRFGIGGDFKYVHNGVAELRVVEKASRKNPALVIKRVVNVPAEPEAEQEAEEGGEAAEAAEAVEAAADGANAAAEPAQPAASTPATEAEVLEPVRVKGYKVVGARNIAGPYALPLKAGVGARVTVVEGMWEDVRGRKIDGGERRRGEIRFKRRVQERKAEREALGM